MGPAFVAFLMARRAQGWKEAQWIPQRTSTNSSKLSAAKARRRELGRRTLGLLLRGPERAPLARVRDDRYGPL